MKALHAVVALVGVASLVAGARVAMKSSRHSSESSQGQAEGRARGYVDQLYTWGAPAVSKGYFLKNARTSSGCWVGYRVQTLKTGTFLGIWDVDMVTQAANQFGFYHTSQPTIQVDEKGKTWFYECDDDAEFWPQVLAPSLHPQAIYFERAQYLPSYARDITNLAVLSSYYNERDAANWAEGFGWKLVGSAMWDRKESYLFQYPSMQCVLTFEGSANERPQDWYDNFNITTTSYCGISNSKGSNVIHAGFAGQIKATVDTASFKTQIIPKLGYCSTVTVAGHSLGGALAALFAACANMDSNTWEGQRMTWTKHSPKLLTPIA